MGLENGSKIACGGDLRKGFAGGARRAIPVAAAAAGPGQPPPDREDRSMPGALKLGFAPFATPAKGVLIVFCEEGLKLGSTARTALEPTGDLVTRAADSDRFKGKNGSALDLLAPAGLSVSRLIVIGVGKARDLKAQDFVKLGGIAMGKMPAATSEGTVVADLPGGIKPERVADLALGLELRAYAFDRYKTKRKEGEEKSTEVKVTIAVAGTGAAEKAFAPRA